MTDLFEKSMITLELPRVLELLSEQAVSAGCWSSSLPVPPPRRARRRP